MIFWFSSQNADESSKVSGQFTVQIINWICGIFSSIDRRQLLVFLSKFVRKAAHMTEYTIFYGTLILAYWVKGLRRERLVGATMLTVFLYACSDEFHQLFVEGRAGLFSDVCIGCSISIVISVVLCLCFRRTMRYNKG